MRWIGEFINTERYPNLKINLGRNTYGRPRLLLNQHETCSFTIGAFCSIAEDVKIFVGAFGIHPTQLPSTFPLAQLYGHPGNRSPESFSHVNRFLDIEIGNDVWIGRDATIMAGVRIGNGAVVGTNSVVTRDVEPYSIVAGIPARHIRYRFLPDVIAQFQSLRWWDYPDDHLRKKMALFYSTDIESFFREFPT